MRIIDVEYDSNSNPVNIVCEDDGECYAFRIIEKGQWIATQSADVYRCSNCKKAVKHALLSLLDDVFLKDFEAVLFRTDPIENEAIEVEAKPMKGK